ncbi:ATP-binding protein [Roseateles sp.]|uniref:ATP-binding protein n=1 Tax=Roseateles sp. TaxID=1971397 RepID=UPI003BA5FB6E
MAEGDTLGVADAYWLRYYLAADLGQSAEIGQTLTQAIDAAQKAGDASRELLFKASLARARIFEKPAQALEEAELQWPQSLEAMPAMEAAALEDYRGVMAGMNGQFTEALAALTRAHELALETGQLRRAITVATNLGHTYSRMGEFPTAMAWLQQAMASARHSQWPNLLSLCLAHAGEALRCQGRSSEARELLHECLALNRLQPDSRTAALALAYLGHTELDSGEATAARQAFSQLLHGREQAPDLKTKAHLGLARAELMLGRFGAAREHAEIGLSYALQHGDHNAEVDFLWVQADIAKAEPRSESPGRSDLQVLKLFMEALLRAEAIEPHVPDPSLLEGTAQAFATCGSYERAYHMLRRAALLRQRRVQQDMALNTAALRSYHQLERERYERAQLQAQAEAESARAQALERSNQLLQHLSRVGQAITHELRHDRIFAVLAEHCDQLLGTPCQAIWLIEDDVRLQCAYAAPGYRPPNAAADFPWQAREPEPAAWCAARTRTELLHDEQGRLVTDLARDRITSIHSPLICGERLLGVLSLQLGHGSALSAQQRLAWRSLQAFTAIALDNANVHRHVAELRQQLLAREKMLATATLLAGMAHELNTPVGNSRLAASAVLDQWQLFEKGLARQSLRRSEWERFAEQTKEGLRLIDRNMARADHLIGRFKQFSVQRDSELPQLMDLRALSERCAQAVAGRLQAAGLYWHNEIPERTEVFGYPVALSQVLSILLDNALSHAFEGRSAGHIAVGCTPLASQGLMTLWLQDDGCGIVPELLERVFDPFFTTRMGQGGQGLGLSVALNLVQGLMGGTLRARSEPGRGSRFQVDLPCVGDASGAGQSDSCGLAAGPVAEQPAPGLSIFKSQPERGLVT